MTKDQLLAELAQDLNNEKRCLKEAQGDFDSQPEALAQLAITYIKDFIKKVKKLTI